MSLKRFIIWIPSLGVVDNLIEALNEYSVTTEIISDHIFCIETTLSDSDIESKIDPSIEISCVELDTDFLHTLSKTKFNQKERRNLNRFIKITKSPTSIDEVLDLIISKGGVEHLHPRELETLNNLTNNPL